MNAMTESQPPAAGQQAAPPAGQPAPAPAMGETVEASPEEQALYEHFVAKAWELVYGEQMFPKVLDMLKGGGDPVEGLAQTAAAVIGRVASAADQAGQQVPGDVMLNAATEVFEDLANLATKAKVHDFEHDQEALEGAYFRTMDGFRTMLQQAGKIDQNAASADMERLIQMDKDGQLEQAFRRLAGEQGSGGPEAGAEPPAEPVRGEQPKRPGGLMQEEV